MGGDCGVRQEKKMKVTRVFHTNKGDGKTSYEKERKKNPSSEALFDVNFHYSLGRA